MLWKFSILGMQVSQSYIKRSKRPYEPLESEVIALAFERDPKLFYPPTERYDPGVLNCPVPINLI